MTSLRAWCCAGLLPLIAIGCKTASVAAPASSQPALVAEAPPPFSSRRQQEKPSAAVVAAPVVAIDFHDPLPMPPLQAGTTSGEIIGDVLSREWLRTEVEARNPSLEAMLAAWQAAAQRYPQQIALDDPMLMGMLAPQSAASNATETAYAFQLNQKLPWFGKRRLRGAAAEADADAAFQDAEDARLTVRLAADLAFFDYFLATRLSAINRENTLVMNQLRETAQAKYVTNQDALQDLLQADVELADLARRQLELDRMQRVAIARINTLLRRWPDAPLPPLPGQIEMKHEPVDSSALWQMALQQRPELAALAWRTQSAEAALELAYKNFYPDFDAFGRYDTFWQPASTQGPLRAQVGVAMNLPVYREKLRAAVCEAQFRLAQRRAEFDQRAQEIQYEVVSAAEQVEESRRTVELFAQRLLPAAEQNVAAIRQNYVVGKATFLSLAQAQRQLIANRERQLEAVVTYQRRLAELDRAVGQQLTAP